MLSPDDTGSPSAGLLDGPVEAPVSRRALLRGAAAAGVAGIGVYTIAGAAGTAVAATDAVPRPAATRGDDAAGAADQIVVHIRDARSGRLDIFHGTNETSLRDPDLVARLVRASQG
jgi:hypothetical protein